MRHIIAFMVLLSSALFPFAELQYQSTPKETFEFFGSMASMGTATTTQQAPSIGFYGVNYRFDNIGYGFNIYPAQLSSGDSFAWTSHNLYAQIYEGFPILMFEATLQVGLVNLGLPQSSLKNTTFTNYLQTYYITNKLKLNDYFNFYISSGPRGDGQAFYHRAALEYIYNGNRGFLEFSPNKNQIYIGGEVGLTKEMTFSIASNITTSTPDINGDYFFPSITMGLRVLNPFIKKKAPPKPVPPVDIDLAAFNAMEKGLIAYYDSDYKKALRAYLSVVKKYPGFALAHIRLGNTYYKLNQTTLAKEHWKAALKLDPKNDDVFEILARVENIDLKKSALINE